MTFEVERELGQRRAQDADPDRDPRRHTPGPSLSSSKEPVDVAGLGLCYPIRTHVVAVRPDSPAAKAGLKPGDVINAMLIPPVKPKASSRSTWRRGSGAGAS